jgi:glycine dehydrogenase
VKTVVIQDILSLAISKPAGEMGADIAVGSVQRFGIPMGFGGPHSAYLACKDEIKRKMPGRIIGISKDRHGNVAYRMALQTREQHIRRDKATSNICTAQALLANMSALFGIWHGPQGLKDIATRIRFRSELLVTQLKKMGIHIITSSDNFFDTIAIDVSKSDLSSADAVLAEFHKFGINLRKIDDSTVGISMNEYTTIKDLAELLEIFAILKEIAPEENDEPYLDANFCNSNNFRGMPAGLKRTSAFMEQQVFNTLTSETEFMRYIHKLGDKDLSLVHGMIPLGSCTMKLNSAIVMAPITFDGFANIHPFAPRD